MADLTHAVAGPFCTYHLARCGADVIKIEVGRLLQGRSQIRRVNCEQALEYADSAHSI